MVVRIATTSDGPKLAHVQLETWRVVYAGLISDAVLGTHNVREREEFWRERLGRAIGSVFVAEQESIVGFCDFIPSEDEGADSRAVGEIAAIYVWPGHWRQGTGRALCSRALAEARRHGYRTVTLWAFEAVPAALEFYKAMEFKLDGARKTLTLPDGSELRQVRFQMPI